VIVYSTILLVALSILTYGIFTLAPMELKVLHDRQPLFVQLSNGAYRNKYELKVMNKTDKPMLVDISFESEIDNLKPIKELTSVEIPTGNVKSIYVYLKAFEKDVGDNNDVIFSVISDSASLKYKSSFFTPKSVR